MNNLFITPIGVWRSDDEQLPCVLDGVCTVPRTTGERPRPTTRTSASYMEEPPSHQAGAELLATCGSYKIFDRRVGKEGLAAVVVRHDQPKMLGGSPARLMTEFEANREEDLQELIEKEHDVDQLAMCDVMDEMLAQALRSSPLRKTAARGSLVIEMWQAAAASSSRVCWMWASLSNILLRNAPPVESMRTTASGRGRRTCPNEIEDTRSSLEATLDLSRHWPNQGKAWSKHAHVSSNPLRCG